MQAVAITKLEYQRNWRLLDSIFQLRANIFKDRLDWNVSVIGGRERDEYDRLKPTYVVALTDRGDLAGCARLLPATGPTMATNTFPQLLATGRVDAHSGMIESSRFCVDTTESRHDDKQLLHEATATLFCGIIEWSIANGYDEIVTVTDIRFERILKRIGWPLTRLGDALSLGNTIAVAGLLAATEDHFERLRPHSYQSGFRQIRQTVA